MNFRLTQILLILTGVMFSTSNISAQEDLSLENAIKIGLVQNFDIQLTQKGIEINELQNTWGQAGRYPTIGLNIQQGNNISDQSNNPTAFIQQLLISNSLQSGVSLNWVLFNGFRVQANKEKLEQLEFQSEGQSALVIENTIQGIILNYYSANLQKEKLVLLNNVLELSRAKWNHEKAKQDLGLALKFDLLQYESAYLTDSSNILLQKLALTNSLNNLNLLMGVNVGAQWNLIDDMDIQSSSYEFESLKNKMLSNNQNIKNEYINLEILSKDISLAKATMYPVLSFGAGASSNLSSFKLGNDRLGGSTLNYYGNFTLSFTLYDGGKVKRGIKALEIQNEVNEIQMNKLKSTLTVELSNQYNLYNTRLEILKIAKLAFKVAEQNFDIASLKENAGIINSFMLREIESSYLASGIAMVEAGFNMVESQTNISRLTGGLVDER
ncbi:MAG: outer membrane protein [Flavobacteriales bacterium]|jgi:outer membrane protein